MGLLDKISIRDLSLSLVVAAATCYIGFGLTRVPESKPASLERTKTSYSGKLENGKVFTFIPTYDGSFVNAEERRDMELDIARTVYNSKKSGLNKEYSDVQKKLRKEHDDLQKKLRNFEYK
jgi:hypothetical protein